MPGGSVAHARETRGMLRLTAAVSLLLAFLAAGAARAEPLPDLPELPGLWKPVVGKGAVYEVKDPERTLRLRTAVVGEEKDGVWLEEVVTGEPGQLAVKVLLNHDGVQRLIVQPGADGPALELPPMGVPGKPGAPAAGESEDVSKKGELVGPEQVTTPAGTFATMRYKVDDETEVWVTPDIPPLGVVKCRKGEVEFTLVEILDQAASVITKEPRKLRPGD